MSDEKQPLGSIGWIDLTIENADEVRDFYQKVTGWKSADVSMGDYYDYCMLPDGAEAPVAGVCHAKGVNEGIPPQWIIYITVEDLEKSMAACKAAGGSVVVGPKEAGGHGRYCVIKDPSGAAAGLFEYAG